VPESERGHQRTRGTVAAGLDQPLRAPPIDAGAAGSEPTLGRGNDDVRVLLRDIIDMLAARSSVTPGERPLVLDVDVDGLRCLVLVEAHVDVHRELSPREHEIARMVGQGYPNKTIAAILGISSWTVSTHLRRMFAKLGVRSRAEMVARVLEEELGVEERPWAAEARTASPRSRSTR
jgi:DNA-binding CsgD family transcriptional regulator